MDWIKKTIRHRSDKLPWFEVSTKSDQGAKDEEGYSGGSTSSGHPPMDEQVNRQAFDSFLRKAIIETDPDQDHSNHLAVKENWVPNTNELKILHRINIKNSGTGDQYSSTLGDDEDSWNYKSPPEEDDPNIDLRYHYLHKVDPAQDQDHHQQPQQNRENLSQKSEPLEHLLWKGEKDFNGSPFASSCFENTPKSDLDLEAEELLESYPIDFSENHNENSGLTNDQPMLNHHQQHATEQVSSNNGLYPASPGNTPAKPIEPLINPLSSNITEKKVLRPAESDLFTPASTTPFIHASSQYQIPFNILHTSDDSVQTVNPQESQKIITILEETLEEFGIEARVIGMQRGPIITRYELRIPPGVKVNRILSLNDELAMALEAIRIRIEAPIPGRSTIGIEIPNRQRAKVLLGDILSHNEFQEHNANLPLPMGKDIAGNILIEDLARMPHLLIAGATGAGKSVAINSFITSLILTRSPEEVRLLLIDPKLVELSHFNDIPHLVHPVIADPQKAILALNWAVEEMERRYEDMAEMRSRDIVSYNHKVEEYNRNLGHKSEVVPKMPYIIVLIDELGDLMMVAGKEVESSIIRLSQKARAVGIHLILATQRPSVDVITALIKANCPARIALQVAQKTDSRTILDSNGGEQLLGQGDMLFKHPSKAQLIRAQSPYVADNEVEEVVNHVKKLGKPAYITLEDPKSQAGQLELEDEDMFEEAWEIIVESNKASASYLQRRLRIGYNRAARLIEAFEARGYIGPQVGSKPREIIGPVDY